MINQLIPCGLLCISTQGPAYKAITLFYFPIPPNNILQNFTLNLWKCLYFTLTKTIQIKNISQI